MRIEHDKEQDDIEDETMNSINTNFDQEDFNTEANAVWNGS